MAVVNCSCGVKFRAKDESINTTLKCPRCGQGVKVGPDKQILPRNNNLRGVVSNERRASRNLSGLPKRYGAGLKKRMAGTVPRKSNTGLIVGITAGSVMALIILVIVLTNPTRDGTEISKEKDRYKLNPNSLTDNFDKIIPDNKLNGSITDQIVAQLELEKLLRAAAEEEIQRYIRAIIMLGGTPNDKEVNYLREDHYVWIKYMVGITIGEIRVLEDRGYKPTVEYVKEEIMKTIAKCLTN